MEDQDERYKVMLEDASMKLKAENAKLRASEMAWKVVAENAVKERNDAVLQIDELKRQQKSDVYTMGEISKCRDEAFRQLDEQQKKYSDLLQSHASLCGKIEELKEKKCVHEMVREFSGACKDHGLNDCRTCAEKRNCPSTYTHSSLGKLACEKDQAHLHRTGDVEHRRGQTIWMSI